jgi:hypothetical protein
MYTFPARRVTTSFRHIGLTSNIRRSRYRTYTSTRAPRIALRGIVMDGPFRILYRINIMNFNTVLHHVVSTQYLYTQLIVYTANSFFLSSIMNHQISRLSAFTMVVTESQKHSPLTSNSTSRHPPARRAWRCYRSAARRASGSDRHQGSALGRQIRVEPSPYQGHTHLGPGV